MTRTVCNTCPKRCALDEGQIGACRARVNSGGAVVAHNYGRVTSLALDPVEKKPFSRWMSGSYVLSVGSYGCNLHCPFCQNASISQVGESDVGWEYITPESLVAQALQLDVQGCIGLAYTYNEPLVGWEYVRDCAQFARDAGLKNALVTNGAVNSSVFAEVLPLVDAVNIDLKAFNADFYRTCGLDAFNCVKANIEAAADAPTCHLEVTTLFVPDMSSTDDVLAAGKWLASLDQSIPYHISQYHPAYKMHQQPVPISTLCHLVEELRTMLDTIIPGNLPPHIV